MTAALITAFTETLGAVLIVCAILFGLVLLSGLIGTIFVLLLGPDEVTRERYWE